MTKEEMAENHFNNEVLFEITENGNCENNENNNFLCNEYKNYNYWKLNVILSRKRKRMPEFF